MSEEEEQEMYEEEEEEQAMDLLQDDFVVPLEQGGRGEGGVGASECTILRPGFQVTQGVSYYNWVSLYVLYYAHVTEGVPIPSIFSSSTTTLDKPNVEFSF